MASGSDSLSKGSSVPALLLRVELDPEATGSFPRALAVENPGNLSPRTSAAIAAVSTAQATAEGHAEDSSGSQASLNSSYEVIPDDEVQKTPKWAGSRRSGSVEKGQEVFPDGPSRPAIKPKGLPDPGALMELEIQAGQIADSLNHMLGNMQSSLQAMSGRTLCCVEAYRESVDELGDAVDENIKLMYSLISKCEMISYRMKFIQAIADQIKSIKQTLTIFEKMCK